ncbi:MAG: hypothetical protein ACRC80_23220 [Waterburya sp.]
MRFRSNGMRFRFKGKHYVANMTASEIYGDGRAGSAGNNIPIQLPDGRFVKVDGWMESLPPQASGFVVINDDEIEKYATAELIIS